MDFPPPQVVITNLDADPLDVGTRVRIKLQFDQLISEVCVSAGSVVISGGSNLVPLTAKVESDGVTLTVDPVNDLSVFTDYSLSLMGICNLSRTEISEYVLDFTTGSDSGTGTVFPVDLTPDDRSVDVPLDTTITLEVSQPLDPIRFTKDVNSNRIRVYDSTNADVIGQWELSGKQIIFTPDVLLPAGERINLRFDGGALLSQGGSSTSRTYTYYFDTITN